MIPLPVYLAFVMASAVLLIMPGPNVALIVSTSIARGVRFGLLTVAGTSSAMVLQLALTVLGMAALLTAAASLLALLRWVGVFYLLYLGIRAWRAVDAGDRPIGAKATSAFLRGFLVSLTNPKTLLFYGAFLPQFVSPAHPLLPQLLLLSISFLMLAVVFDSTWALLAGRLRAVLALNARFFNRLQGGLLIGAGLGLALARKT